MAHYLNHSATGEVRLLFLQAFDLPRYAESKVAFHFSYFGERPLLEGGG